MVIRSQRCTGVCMRQRHECRWRSNGKSGAPECFQNLAGWQRFFSLDLHSTQVRLTVEFDVEAGTLQWHADGPLPATQVASVLPEGARAEAPGPHFTTASVV